MPKNYIEITQVLQVNFDRETTDRWLKLTNKAITGSEVPLRDQQASEYHKSVHWNVNCCRRIKVKFRLYDDGSLEVLPEASFKKANHAST